MTNQTAQEKAASYIRTSLRERGLDLLPTDVVERGERWLMFEWQERRVAVDSKSALWIWEARLGKWAYLGKPFSVSAILEAVEYLAEK